jgi:predicted  nucleic acid-binding Zn-ribbon protein
MAFAFDTLSYAERLRDAGISVEQAEAHGDAARDFVMAELVTKSDLLTAVAPLAAKSDLAEVKLDLAGVKGDLVAAMAAVATKTDLAAVQADVAAVKIDLAGVKSELSGVMGELTKMATKIELAALREEMAGMRREIRAAIDNVELRLTVHLGTMLVAGVAVLAVINKL